MKHSLVLLLLWGAGGLSLAAPPGWWTAEPTRIIETGATPNNAGIVNQAQLKNVATKAALYLDALPGGRGAEITALLATLQDTPSTALLPANLGQLKHVAKPFYTRLLQVGYNTKQSLRSHGGSNAQALSWTHDYPWDDSTAKSVNLSPASIGQLKWVFSFDLTGFTPIDLPDEWETLYFGSTGHFPLADEDGDGTSNIDEYNAGTSPLAKDNPLVQLQVTVTLQ